MTANEMTDVIEFAKVLLSCLKLVLKIEKYLFIFTSVDIFDDVFEWGA